MANPGRTTHMVIPTLIMALLALVLYIIAYRRGEGQHIIGMKSALQLTLQTLPILIFAFITAGFVQVLLPHDLLSRWVGVESGMRGIFIGTIAGGFTPGGPYVSLPIVAAMLKAGAGPGTMIAFLTSWSLWAVARLPMEVGILGLRFTMLRFACTFFFPPIAGVLAHVLTRFIR